MHLKELNFKSLLTIIFKNDLAKSTGVYALANILNGAIPFLVIPILTTHLSPLDYGIVAMFYISCNILNPFIGVSTVGFVQIKYFESDINELKKYIGNCFYIFFSSIVILFIVIIVFQNFFSRVTTIPYEWIWTIFCYSICNYVSQIVMVLWQVRKQSISYAAFQVLQTILNISLTIFFVVYLKYNWQGRIGAIVITSLLFAFIAFFILLRRNEISFKFDLKFVFEALKFGIPIIPHTLGGVLIGMADRFLLTNIVGVEETGIYSLATQLGMIIYFLTTSFNNAYSPWLFMKLNENNLSSKIKIVKFTYLYFISLPLVGVIYLFGIHFLLHYFVGENFLSSERYLVWLIIGNIFQGMYFMVTNYIIFLKKTHILAIVTAFTAIFNIVLNYLLITSIGSVGAAITFAISWFLFFVITWILSASLYKMPWFSLNILSKHDDK